MRWWRIQFVAGVMEPSTPEGVEHLPRPRRGRTLTRQVMEPSTPEGVEHQYVQIRPELVSHVMEPSTPEGVEHGSSSRSRRR